MLNPCLFGIQSSGHRILDLPPVLAFWFLVRHFFRDAALASPLISAPAVLVAAEGRSLFHLHREVKFLEQRQIKQLNHSQTHAVVPTAATSK